MLSSICFCSRLIVILAIFTSAVTAHSQTPDQTILYTGKLLGYYTLELDGAQRECLDRSATKGEEPAVNCGAQPQGVLPQRDTLLDQIDTARNFFAASNPILVGMGDNFAPQLESRLLRFQWKSNALVETVSLAGKEPEFAYALKRLAARPKHDWHEPDSLNVPQLGFAAQDNVANFLMKAQYRAIVPGREDFLYGAVRLAQLAYLLRVDTARVDTPPFLHMLAANLRYKMVADGTAKMASGPDKPPCPLLFQMANANALDRNPTTRGTVTLISGANDCKPDFKFNEENSGMALGWEGVGYTIVKDNGRNVLIVGVVDKELFSEVGVINRRFRASADSKDVYEVFATEPEDEVKAILLALEAKHTPIDTRILLAQMPRSKAEELLAHLRRNPLCNIAVPPLEESCKGTGGFDVVISQADEAHATANQTVNERPANAGGDQGYLATPHPAYSSVGKKLVDPLSTIEMTTSYDCIGFPAKITFSNSAKWMDNSFPSPEDVETTISSDNSYGITDYDLKKPNNNGEIATRSLQSLQWQTGADVVLLQQRDFFFKNIVIDDANCDGLADKDSNSSTKIAMNDCLLRNRFQRQFWKGDILSTTNLTGKQIKSILNKSKTLSEEEHSISTRDARGEWLVTFGLWRPRKEEKGSQFCSARDPKETDALSDLTSFVVPTSCYCHIEQTPDTDPKEEQYCINGRQIDDSTVYRIATTDHLASGSEVYPEFKKPAVLKVEAIYKSPEHTTSIAENVLLRWHQASQQQQVHAQAFAPVEEPDPREFRQQERAYLHYQLQKLTVSFNEYKPNMSDIDIGKHFAGVADSRADTPHSSSIDLEEGLRLLREGRFYDFGVQSTLAYKMDRTGKTDGSADTVKYSQNQYLAGPVFQLHVGGSGSYQRFLNPHWFSKILPAYKLVIAPYQITGQVHGSRVAFAADKSITQTNPSAQQVFNANVQWSTAQRVGLRHEFHGGGLFFPDKNSFYEIGYQWSFQHNVLTALTLVNPGNSAANQRLPCPILATISLSDCVKNLQKTNSASKSSDIIVGPSTTFAPTYTRHPVYSRGTYWTGSMNFPLRGKDKPFPLSFLLEGNGDYFNDLGSTEQFPTQTRFDVTSSLGVQLPIWGNLSAVPKYTLFLYENQIARDWLKSDNVTIELRWTFDRNSAIGPRVALGYKSDDKSGSGNSSDSSTKNPSK